jgi:OmpA-OmpF porin, OOP family
VDRFDIARGHLDREKSMQCTKESSPIARHVTTSDKRGDKVGSLRIRQDGISFRHGRVFATDEVHHVKIRWNWRLHLFRTHIIRFSLLAVCFSTAFAQNQLKVYQNYDFQPGNKILFEDDFSGDKDGEFPARWKLDAGQAVLNKIGDAEALFVTDGNYGRVSPRMKTAAYLGKEFTLEFDIYMKSGSYGLAVFFKTPDDGEGIIQLSKDEVSTASFAHDFSKQFPESFAEDLADKWHHAAIAVKDKQIKVYVDQLRALVVPDCECTLNSIGFGGIASDENPLIFRNVRLAEGGAMNMIGKLTAEGKIVTHGILFDTGKATLKPQSMGVINELAKTLKDNAAVKIEIDGHTDSDGNAQLNQKLSQDRADAVKSQLVAMGIDGGRLTTKGFGASKPIDVNTTPEGKANNRRDEFVKVD